MRTKFQDERIVIADCKNPILELSNIRPDTISATAAYKCKSSELKDELANFEARSIDLQYKFGVLYVKTGQTEEEQWYNNTETPPALTEFMNFLADKVPLKGWTKFRGGLNTQNDSTGTESYYTSFHHFEVMFHISTMIPFHKDDTQQIERKRHLGNDVVIIVFRDEDNMTPFSPSVIRSQFNHIFCVVQPHHSKKSKETRYRIAICSKNGVPTYTPALPLKKSFVKNQQLRTFLLSKLINGERATYYAPDFKTRLANARLMNLKLLQEQFPKK